MNNNFFDWGASPHSSMQSYPKPISPADRQETYLQSMAETLRSLEDLRRIADAAEDRAATAEREANAAEKRAAVAESEAQSAKKDARISIILSVVSIIVAMISIFADHSAQIISWLTG